jgi:hypothetical protein
MDKQNFSYFDSEYPQKVYSEIVSRENLKPIAQLLKESWRIYRLKIKTLLGIVGLPVGFSFLFWILMYFLAGTSLKYSVWFSVAGAISCLGSLFLWLWAVPSLLYSLKENTAIKESYKRGFRILASYTWVYFLLTIIIVGGFLLFFVPGLIFSIWFSLAIFILVFEERKGFNALFKSKHLVRGKFWEVFWRILVLGLITGLGLLLIFALILFGIENRQTEKQMGEAMGYFIQLFLWPLFLIYGLLIYNNLKEIKTEIPYEKPAWTKKIKYIIAGILGALLVGLIIILSFLNIFWGRDIPPIDDNDLRFSETEVSKEKNAFYYFNQASEKLSKDKAELFRKMAEGKEWDSEFAEKLIKNNEEVFDYFERALELPYFQPHDLSGWRDLGDIAKLNLIKADYLLRQGKEKESLDLILETLRMGQMIEDSPRSVLYSFSVGERIKESGLQRLRMMIPRLTLPTEVLKDYVAGLNQFKANEEGLIKAIKAEYISFANTKSKMDAVFVGGLPWEKLGMKETPFEIKLASKLNYLYKPNQTKRMFAEYYRNLVHNASKDCHEMNFLEIKPSVNRSKIQMLFTENAVGKTLYNNIAISFSSFFDRKCLEDFSISGTQLLMAIKAYQGDTGELPRSLNDLVPKYFTKIPADPFDGKLIKYSPKKKIIYSVGKDLKDSGGSEGKDLRTMKDPTFKIEF